MAPAVSVALDVSPGFAAICAGLLRLEGACPISICGEAGRAFAGTGYHGSLPVFWGPLIILTLPLQMRGFGS